MKPRPAQPSTNYPQSQRLVIQPPAGWTSLHLTHESAGWTSLHPTHEKYRWTFLPPSNSSRLQFRWTRSRLAASMLQSAALIPRMKTVLHAQSSTDHQWTHVLPLIDATNNYRESELSYISSAAARWRHLHSFADLIGSGIRSQSFLGASE